MRTDEPHPIRLQDYRPPDWLVDTVELDVSLDASATRVRASLLLRPNPKAAAPAPPAGARGRRPRAPRVEAGGGAAGARALCRDARPPLSRSAAAAAVPA